MGFELSPKLETAAISRSEPMPHSVVRVVTVAEEALHNAVSRVDAVSTDRYGQCGIMADSRPPMGGIASDRHVTIPDRHVSGTLEQGGQADAAV